MRDQLYDHCHFRLSELEHRYGPEVHLLSNPFLLTQLATLCAKETTQPAINRLVALLYTDLVKTFINVELPHKPAAIPTRMIDQHPLAVFQGEVIDPAVRVVTVNIARAGTLPSQVTYDLLNQLLDPRLVRQDHIVMARQVDEGHRVIGSQIFGSKIGGDVDDAFLLFPDPMGATGGSMVEAIQWYKDKVSGHPRRIVTLNLIVTPEYLRRVRASHPEVVIYALRLDRALSPPDVLASVPGTHWDRERGLDDRQYIIPGGGGFGEIMNNSYV